jgi:hypothetical protein
VADGNSSERIRKIAKSTADALAEAVTRRIEKAQDAQPTCMRPCPTVAAVPPKDIIVSDAAPTAIEPKTNRVRTTMAVLSQSTTVKVSAGVIVGALVSAGVWAWDGLDGRIKAKADAVVLEDTVRRLEGMSSGLTDHEKRIIELKTRREIDDRETAEYRSRDAADKAEIKASLRRIEDFMMRKGN